MALLDFNNYLGIQFVSWIPVMVSEAHPKQLTEDFRTFWKVH